MDADRYMAAFLDEGRDIVAALGDALAEGDATEAFRAAHTLKGMAATMGLTGVVEVAHAMESTLEGLRQGVLRQEPGRSAVLASAAGALAALLGPAPAEVDVPALLQALDATRELTGRVPGAAGTPVAMAYRIEVTLAETCLMPGPRAWMVAELLAPLGTVSPVEPPVEALAFERSPVRFALTVRTTAPAAVLEAALGGVGDVTALNVRPLEAPAGSATPIAAQERRVPQAPKAVRVSLDQLDAMESTLEALDAELKGGGADAATHAAKLRAQLAEWRLVPLSGMFEICAHATADLARALNKRARLETRSELSALPPAPADALGTALVHLVRNAVDHGIESPAERLAAGKPEEATLRLTLVRDQGAVVATLSDDGRGIDARRVKETAIARGLLSPEAAASLAPQALSALIFAPGFSTAERVTHVSGRGVGLETVRERVEALGGRVEVESTPGAGTAIRLVLPLGG